MANEKVNVTKEWLLSFYNTKIKPYLNGASGAIDDSSTASNKTWSAQKIGNEIKHTYSTTEKAVGTWADGKTIYEKSFYGTLPSNLVTTDGTQGTYNVASFSYYPVEIIGHAYSGSDTSVSVTIPNAWSPGGGATGYYSSFVRTLIQGGYIQLTTNRITFNSGKFRLIVRYTKTL